MDVNLDLEFDKFAFGNVCGKRCQYIDHIFQFTCLCICNGILYLIDIYYNTCLRLYLSIVLVVVVVASFLYAFGMNVEEFRTKF